jgi:hypothetical protein
MYRFEIVLTDKGYHGRFVQIEPRKILWYTSDRDTSAAITELMNTIALNSQKQTIVSVDER